MKNSNDTFKKIISHAKEYGFIFQSSEIYDGLSAVYDYGHNGVELKNNLKKYWWASMVQMEDNIVGLDSSILMHPKISLTPHIGAATSEAQERIGAELANQICDFYKK